MTDQAREARMTFDSLGAVGSQVERRVMPLAPERAAFVAWLRLEPRSRDDYWREDIKMGEHDAALAAWRHQQREIDHLRAALLQCARQAEALKRECGMDHESAQAVRNAQYQAISTTAHIALGTIKGPRQIETVATVTECEACFTPDVCQLRGTCDHYSAERLRIAKANP